MTEKLTKEEIAKFREGFDLFDSDGDGIIASKELGSLIRYMGFNPSEAEISEMIAKADFEKGGKIDFSGFIDLVAGNLKSEKGVEDELNAAFKTFDKNGDGYISTSELRLIMTNIGEKLTDAEIEEMMEVADLNGDGKIDYAEFVIMMSKQ